MISPKYFYTKIISLPDNAITKYLLSVFILTIICSILFLVRNQIGYQAVSLVLLFIISLLPLFNFGPGPIFFIAVTSAVVWNYFFIPPQFTFHIEKVEDALMFGMYFIIALVSGFLISRIRKQQIFIEQKERRTSALYNLSRELSSSKSIDDVIISAVKQIKDTFNAGVVFLFPDSNKKLKPFHNLTDNNYLDDSELETTHWVFTNSQKAGRFTNNLPSLPTTYFPVVTRTEILGVVGLRFSETTNLTPDLETLLNTFISQISVAIEREYLKELGNKAFVLSESEKLYKTLFDSISHELKTPLTAIIGATSSLKQEKIKQNSELLTGLINEINIAAERLYRLVENLLDITRLESGNLKPKLEWHSILDLIDSAIEKIKNETTEHEIIFKERGENIIYKFDFALLEQAIVNILLNSINYTEPGCKIKISLKRLDKNIVISVSDNGYGFPADSIPNLFRKFYRIPGTKAGGTGLGLSIARGFIEAHKGTITAQNKNEGGAEFIILLPID